MYKRDPPQRQRSRETFIFSDDVIGQSLVDRWRFGPPSWSGNGTATPRQTDSDHAECFIGREEPYRI